MTFESLKAELRPLLWPEGEAENLVAIHDAFFNEALYDLCKFVPCYGYPHSDVYPHCASFFNCGRTVLPKPAGSVIRVYTVDKLNDQGQEDADAEEDHCATVDYHQVSFEMLQRYVQVCERCNASLPAQDEILTAIFGVFRVKRRYPPPTDVGFEDQPPLPPGFHYPQAATDASGRSAGGVWAIKNGKIYIAPWIQSTESVVVEWVGLKSKWGDADEIEDDIKFKQAVRVHVAMQHEAAFGEAGRAGDLRSEFYGNQNLGIPGILPTLIHECKEQSRLRDADSERSSSPVHSAIGLGKVEGQFFNDIAAQYTATCPEGQVGSVTATVPVGTVASPVSVADANARAQAKAQADAQAKLVCEDAEAVFFNVELSATAYCPPASGSNPAATGTPVVKTVAAGKFTSSESQEAADAAAYAYALRQAEFQRNATGSCTYHNAAQSFTAYCTPPLVGQFTADIPVYDGSISTYDSVISQDDSNEKAKIAAQNAAYAGLNCYQPTDPTSTACNDFKEATCTGICGCSGRARTVVGHGFVTKCELSALCKVGGIVNECQIKKNLFNAQAEALAKSRAARDYYLQCQGIWSSCAPGSFVVFNQCS